MCIRDSWSPEAVKRVTGKELTGLAANGIIHLINSGATTLDGTGQQTNAQGEPCLLYTSRMCPMPCMRE